MHRSHLGSYILVVLLSLYLFSNTANVFAQQHQNLERGLGAASNQSDTIDNVNLYNGNLSLVIPLGQTFNGGGTFNYRLTLVYNSNVWDFKSVFDNTQPASGFVNQAVPDPKTNAGLGWNLSLGKLYRNNLPELNEGGSWLYVGSDGREHSFFPTLLPGDAPDGKMYTRDGSYLRLTVLDCPGTPMQCNSSRGTVEFPDGQIHSFSATGRLEQMKDRFDNQVTLTYFLDRIELIDEFQRKTKIWLTPQNQVDKVELPAFNTSLPATYDFSYINLNIARHEKDHYNWALNGKQERVTVQVLDSLTLPAGAGSYKFTYETDYGTGGVPGVVRSASLPTLGRYEWDFTQYRFPVNDPTEPRPSQEPSFQARISSSDGVRTKRIFAPGAVTTTDQWEYTQRVNGIGTESDPRSATLTIVKSPAGDETVHHFNTTYDSWDYGLPFTLKSTNADGSLFLSQEIYKGLASGGDKRRIVYVRYEADGGLAPGTNGSPASNPRRAIDRTLFLDDGNRHRTVSNSDYDGLGHYRQTTVSGNFISGASGRVTTTNYNPNGKPPVNSSWILNTYDQRTETENGHTAKRFYCYDASNGFLNQERVLSGGSPSPNDIVIQYSHSENSQGAVSKEEYFGGDSGGAGTSRCATLSGNQYQLNYTYAFGSVATKAYTDANGTSLSFNLVNRQIDSNTGLPSSERDQAGIEDNFEFDALGRLILITPTQSKRALTQVQYVTATSPTNPAKKIVRQLNEATGVVHTETIMSYDGFGRETRKEDLMANNVRGAVETTYNAMGWRLSVSEKMSGTPSMKTQYRNFDPFGRPQSILPADGAAHEILISYGGIRSTTRSVRMGLSQSNGAVSEDWVATTEIRDEHGRLFRAIENANDTNNDIIAEYGYDVGNRLNAVKVIARDGVTTQNRAFNYDNRGFLLSEVNPENGTTFYAEYDSRGHARRVRRGVAGGPFDLRTLFDRAERATEIKEAGGAQRTIKKMTYSDGTTGGTWSNGKLVTAVRHNYHDRFNRDILVTENYSYNANGGAVSQRDTLVNTGDGQLKSFTQGWTYTNLGQVETTTYPQCQNLECKNTAGTTPLTINYAYSRGYLSQVGGFVNQTTYHPNGLINQMTYANGVVMTQANDPNAIARTAKISTSGVVANADGIGNFDTGQYKYDGAGNIIKIGTNHYVYDAFNRLTEGTQFSRENWRQNYSYDDFGNLTQINTVNPLGVTDTLLAQTSTTNNRLIRASYDPAGNQSVSGNNQYLYDSLNMIKQFQEVVNGGVNQDWIYVYTADDQRIWSYNMTGGQSSWKLRDLDGKVLREYRTAGVANGAVVWAVDSDYVYHGAKLVGIFDPVNNSNNKFIMTDHLGTPRLIVNQSKQAVEAHHYLPYGLERPVSAANTGSLQFTGHERDGNGVAGESDDLDYMHARYYDMRKAKFLSVDPGRDNDPSKPQSWNRYAYVRNNPINKIDPDGKFGGLAQAIYVRHTTADANAQASVPVCPLYCDWKIQAAMKSAWNRAQLGKSGVEAGFRVNRNKVVPFLIIKSPTTNQRNQQTHPIEPGTTFAEFHVHPNASGGAPSTPLNKSDPDAPGDTEIAEKYNIQIYTFGIKGLYMYDPGTDQTSKLTEGLNWQKPCSCGSHFTGTVPPP